MREGLQPHLFLKTKRAIVEWRREAMLAPARECSVQRKLTICRIVVRALAGTLKKGAERMLGCEHPHQALLVEVPLTCVAHTSDRPCS